MDFWDCEGSRFDRMDSQGRATHAISILLGNNSSFFDEAQDVAAGDLSGATLREWVRELVYDPQDGLDTDERHTLEQVRDGLARDDFELLVDWGAVRHDLLEF